jgi:hypothetical protein
VEGIPAFGNALPFAGRRRNEGLGRFTRTAGTSSPQYEEPATPRGARGASEEGNLRPRRPAAAGGGEGKVLRSRRLGPRSPVLSSNGHRRKRWSDQGVARKRRFGRTVAFEVSSCDVLAASPGWLRKGCRGSQRSWSFFERGRSPALRKHGESERKFDVTAKLRAALETRMTGCSGVRPCVGS